MWSGWWAAKLKEAAANVKAASSDNPQSLLAGIVFVSDAKPLIIVISSALNFENFKPDDNMTLSSYIK